MRKTFSMLVMLLLCLTSGARRITPTEARQKAQSFMNGRPIQQDGQNSRRMKAKAQMPKSQSFYVFNAEDEKGFVIIAGDDKAPAILGFSDEGNFNLDNVPDNMKWLLDEYEKQIAYLAEHDSDIPARQPRKSARKDIEPMIKTKWGQHEPFNLLCPTVGGSRCPTGCVATAWAQILNYYQWPKQGNDSYSYEWNGHTLSADFENTTYDWDNMVDVYDSNASEEQKQAVAQLMYHCGVIADMEYGFGESAGYTFKASSNAEYFLRYQTDLFSFSEDINLHDWIDMLYAELSENRPVFYGGESSWSLRHAFICDGYKQINGEDMFHFNIGWTGDTDGYYVLSPLQNGELLEFHIDQYVYTIRPDYSPLGYGKLDKQTGTLTFSSGEKPTGDYVYSTRKNLWKEEANDIKKVVFDPSFKDVLPYSTYSWFYECENITEIEGLENLNTSNVTNMGSMFTGCSNLTKLDVSKFNTNSVTNMHSMFQGCASITELDVSHFDTSNVTDLSSMFYNCSGLTQLDVSNFNTSNVTDMYGMFQGCHNITELDVSHFNTCKITNMGNMFDGCSNLTQLDVSNFDTRNVTYMSCMFSGCSNLTQLDVSNFDTKNVTGMSEMFEDCSSLTQLDLSHFDTSNVTDMARMFDDCSGLTKLDVSHFDTGKVTNMPLMFYNCSSLTQLDLSNFDTSNVTNMMAMFRSCSDLTQLDLSNFNTSNVTYMSEMFKDCSSLTQLDLSHFDTNNVTDMGSMFYNCSGLPQLDLSHFDTNNVTYMWSMFYNCSSLSQLDVSNFDTSNVTIMGGMFENCSGLSQLNLSKFNTSNVTSMGGMFENCSSLSQIDLSNFNTSNVTNMGSMFYNCSSLSQLDVSHFNTSNVTNMGHMFYNCSSLSQLDVSHFNTSNVTNMSWMFRDCSALTQLDLSNFNTSNVTGMMWMFYNCSNLTTLDLSSFDTRNATNMTEIVRYCKLLDTLILGKKFRFASDYTISCPALSKIFIANPEVNLPKNFFEWNYNDITMYVPHVNRDSFLDYGKQVNDVYGDLNLDSIFDLKDFQAVVDYVLERDTCTQHYILGDLNADEQVNMLDAVTVIDEVKGATQANSSRRKAESADSDWLLAAADKGEFVLSLTSSAPITAFQMDITLPEDASITEVALNELRTNGHVVEFNRKSDGSFIVVGYSTNKHALNGNSGELLRIKSDVFPCAIQVDNVHLITTSAQERVVSIGYDEFITEVSSPISSQGNVHSRYFKLNGTEITGPSKGILIEKQSNGRTRRIIAQ